jgi:hypothetical protein
MKEEVAYRAPEVTDHGSLVSLTADFDAHFIGSVAQTFTLAAVSVVLPSGPDSFDRPGSVPDSGVLPAGAESGGGDGGVQAGVGGGSGRGGAGRGGALDVAEEGGGGSLPFTGYVAAAVATVGALASATGMALRAKLRRDS